MGGVRFYERREVKDVLAYLKVLANPADEVSLRRIINVPGRGIGETSLARISEQAAASKLTLLDGLAAANLIKGIGPAVRTAAKELAAELARLRETMAAKDAAEVTKATVEAFDYLDYLKDQYPDTEEAQARMENVQELVSAAADFCTRAEDKSLTAFLAEVSLIADIDRWDESTEAVTLMTMHNAKGLEFDHVQVVGLEDGLLPHSASLESQKELEEERRLFYVAITRAGKTLDLYHARARRRYGGLLPSMPSRFLSEIPGKLVERRKTLAGAEAVEPADEGRQRRQALKGTVVRHPVWGLGTVVGTEGEGEDLKLSIQFPGGMRKKIVASFVETEWRE